MLTNSQDKFQLKLLVTFEKTRLFNTNDSLNLCYCNRRKYDRVLSPRKLLDELLDFKFMVEKSVETRCFRQREEMKFDLDNSFKVEETELQNHDENTNFF